MKKFEEHFHKNRAEQPNCSAPGGVCNFVRGAYASYASMEGIHVESAGTKENSNTMSDLLMAPSQKRLF